MNLKPREKYPPYQLVAWTYLGVLVLLPITGLFWHDQWGWMKANWILYPFMVAAIAYAIVFSRKVPVLFLTAIGIFLFYFFIFFGRGGDWESMLRIFIALLPLFFFEDLRTMITPDLQNKFWKIYLAVLLVPIFISLLQVLGYASYYDTGKAYDLYWGRISGGYLKPNNLNAVLFPGYLAGFYLYYRGRKSIGIALSGFLFLVVLAGGLRTSVIAYFLIFLLSFVPGRTNTLIYQAFRYCFFIVIAIGAFFLLSIGREDFGLQEGFRKRLPIWMNHSEYFFHSEPVDILVGKGTVDLPAGTIMAGSEVHNNDFRLMITFGLLGYAFYGVLLRSVALRIHTSPCSDELKFLHSACLIHILIYSSTNEPAFYAGIFWPLTAWIFFMDDPVTAQRKP